MRLLTKQSSLPEITPLITNQSDLSLDQDTADWLFDSANPTREDPLTILLQHEQETEDAFAYYLPRSIS